METTCDMMELCRLCLVKDEVNTPIFEEKGEIRQIFLKISSCLPVKVSREDKLPKKICDGCSCKLDMLYEFCNTSANAEKQLLTWLGQAGINANNTKTTDETMSAVVQMSNKPHETIVKQETIDTSDKEIEEGEETKHVSDPAYMFEQNFSFDDQASSSAGPSAHTNSDEPPPKRAKRAAALRALPITTETDEEDEDDVDAMEPLTKIEGESEESEGEDAEPSFVDAPSTSADDQPGPSGVGKGNIDAPLDMYLDGEPIYGWMGGINEKLKRKAKNLKKSQSINESDSPPNKADPNKRPIKRNSSARDWTCKICLLQFSTRKYLETHRKVHVVIEEITEEKYKFDEDQSVYICCTCSAEFEKIEEIENHVESHDEKFQCIHCFKAITGAFSYACHTQIHSEDKLLECPLCNYTSKTKSPMLNHINKLHYRKFDYQCTQCGKGFYDATNFRDHSNEHLGLRPFVCVVCQKDFVYSRNLLSHQIRNHTVLLLGQVHSTQCSSCYAVFSKPESLQKHMNIRHKKIEGPHEKKHLCDICGQGFSRTDKLKIHYRKHTGDKPYSCSYCGKGFIKRDYMVMHERVHTGEKPYECEICGKCFNQGAPLRIHMRCHTGERPYKCDYCGTGCISRGALNTHLKSCLGNLVEKYE